MSREHNLLPRVGAHKSIIKGIDKAIDRGLDSTCECLQIFTRPPRRWEAGTSTLEDSQVSAFLYKAKKANYNDTAIHMPYLPNLASPDDSLYHRSIKVLQEEISKSHLLKSPYVISHLGSPKIETRKFAIRRVAKALNQVFKFRNDPTMILLENSTSKKRHWGKTIEDIADVLNTVDHPQYVGMCFDTAHAHASGYDLSNPEFLHEIFDKIDSLLGKNKVRVIHLNDSKGKLNSGIDHHEHIGLGSIGLECFRELMQHPRFKTISMVLETPKDERRSDKDNLELLRSLRKN
ncbi:MAG: deoxyribonuclease IV [Candidatus Hodarchaeales archaeon]|jgi:deoxyribonuclease-4